MNWSKFISILLTLLLIESVAVVGISKQIAHAKTQAAKVAAQRNQPMVIYIDRDFNSKERDDIYRAMRAWEKVSDNKLWFTPVWNKPKPGRYHRIRRDGLKPDQGVFLWKINKRSRQFNKTMREKYKRTHGLFVPGPGKNSADIIIFAEHITRKHFYQVALHELGHYLGLNHTDKSPLAIMARHVEGDCITNIDAGYLCAIYGCDPKPECAIKTVNSSSGK